jgi:hypothetical protein
VTDTSRPVLRFDLAAFQKICEDLAAALRGTTTMTRADFVLVPDPVGDEMTDTTDDLFATSIRKSADAAASWLKLADELGAVIERYRSLHKLTVISPIDGDPDQPRLLRSTHVKLDMTEHLTRLERAQVGALGYAGAWEMLSDEWQLALENAQDEGE